MARKNYLYLMWVMALTDFKLKYDNSALGYLWSLLKPLLQFGTLYLVFSVFVRWDVENYKLYLLLGIILWNFFSEVTLNSMLMLQGKASVLKKIYFPRWIIVVSSSLTSVLTLALNMVVYLLFFLMSDVHFRVANLWFVLFLVELYALSLGAAILLCAFYPKLRDIHHIWEVFVQLGFWATPVIYPVSIVPERYWPMIFANPVARIIQGCRQSLIGGGVEFLALASHAAVVGAIALILVVSVFCFSRLSPYFAEDL